MSKLCVITGATSGIGKTVAIELSKRNYHLAIIGRNKEKGEAIIDQIKAITPSCKITFYRADLSSMKEVKQVAQEVLQDYPIIDVLINNAGGVFSKFELTEEGIEKTIGNNHLSYYILTLQLLKAVQNANDGRIINVASGSHYKAQLDFDSFYNENNYQIMKSYGQSKLANILFTYALCDRLKNTGISINTLHPGVVKTSIGGKAAHWLHRFVWNLFSKINGISTQKAAETYVYLATDLEAKKHFGLYFHDGKIKKSSILSYDKTLQEKLWKWSEEVSGISL